MRLPRRRAAALRRLAGTALAGARRAAGCRARRLPARPVAVGAMAAAAGLTAAALARLVAYDDVQTLCAAALKLLPARPRRATGWLPDALPASSGSPPRSPT